MRKEKQEGRKGEEEMTEVKIKQGDERGEKRKKERTKGKKEGVERKRGEESEEWRKNKR